MTYSIDGHHILSFIFFQLNVKWTSVLGKLHKKPTGILSRIFTAPQWTIHLSCRATHELKLLTINEYNSRNKYTQYTKQIYTVKTYAHKSFHSTNNVLKNLKKNNKYEWSGTGRHCCICDRQMLRVHSPTGSTFMHEMTSWPPSWT